MPTEERLRYLEDKWDDRVAGGLEPAELLRYRSNLLGSDLRITNFGGGNTSSKVEQSDPLDSGKRSVLWIKGSGGDIGSIELKGFATLYLEKLLALESRYRGVDHEDEMVGMYPLCGFGNNSVAASIDTPLHGFLPYAHIDHLHPDWGIALAAAANGALKLQEFNRRFGHKLLWLPWQRPGFELAMMLKRAVEKGSTGAANDLSRLYLLGAPGVPASRAESLKWLAVSAGRGNSEAMVTLGYMSMTAPPGAPRASATSSKRTAG